MSKKYLYPQYRLWKDTQRPSGGIVVTTDRNQILRPYFRISSITKLEFEDFIAIRVLKFSLLL